MGTISNRVITAKSGEQILVRTPNHDDAAALIALSKSVIAESEFSISVVDEFQLTEEEERDWIDRHVEADGNIVIVAEVSETVAGLLSCKCGERRRLAHRATLGISVIKEYREIGVGRALMQALIDWAENHPTIIKLSLGVLSTNTRAIRLYEGLGFIQEGYRPKEVMFGPDQYVDDLLMYRFVDGSVVT